MSVNCGDTEKIDPVRGMLAAQILHAFPIRRLVLIALILAFMLPVLTHAYASHDSRYMADDYCTAATAIRTGVGEALDYWYNHWSGRYTAVVLMAVLGKQPPQIYAIVVPVLLWLWVVALTWALSRLFDLLDVHNGGRLSILFAALISYALFDGLPNVTQTVYWVTSAVTYLLPLIGLMAYAGLTVVTLRTSPSLFVFSVELAVGLCILFVVAGCSETYAALQLTLLALLMIAGWRYLPTDTRPRLTIWLTVGLVVTLIGLILMLHAPGNSVRQGYFEPVAPLPVVIERAVTATLGYIFLALWRFTAIPLLAALMVAAAVAYQMPIPPRVGRLSRGFVRKGLLITLGLTLLIMGATIAPSVYALSTPPPARVYLLAQLVLACGTIVWGTLIGWGLQSGDRQGKLRRSRAFVYGGSVLLALLTVIGPLASTVHTTSLAHDFDVYAAAWDAQDQALRAAQGDVVIAPLSVDMAAAANLDVIGPDPHGLANTCASDYYHLQSLRVQ